MFSFGEFRRNRGRRETGMAVGGLTEVCRGVAFFGGASGEVQVQTLHDRVEAWKQIQFKIIRRSSRKVG